MYVPRVSVVLPTLNEEAVVGRALDSLSDQTFADFEVIVVDDGSTDGTLDVVRSKADDLPEVRIVERHDQSGIASALNRGVAEAAGEYIARQDADDRSLPRRFERQVLFLEENSDVALVGTGAYHVERNGSRRSRRRVYENPPLEIYKKKSPFVHGSVMMRTAAVRAVGGYDETFPTAEDRDLWVRMSQEYELRNIDEPLYLLTLSGDSAYASDMYRAKLYGRYAAIRVLDDRIPEGYDAEVEREGIEAIERVLREEELAEIKLGISQELLRWGKRAESRERAVEVLRENPIHAVAAATLVLSIAPRPVTLGVINHYRKLINWRIRRSNTGYGY